MKQKNTMYNLPVVIERDRGGRYIGTIPSLKSCYTYAKTLPVLYKRLHEVAQLCLEVEDELFHSKTPHNEFIGVHTVQVTMKK